jgi:hypothetical protein
MACYAASQRRAGIIRSASNQDNSMFMKSALAVLAIIAFATPAIAQVADQADGQGWAGPGWYVSGGSPLASGPFAEPAWILFNGPHTQESACLDIYARLYSPIGRCRLLDAKPGSFGS